MMQFFRVVHMHLPLIKVLEHQAIICSSTHKKATINNQHNNTTNQIIKVNVTKFINKLNIKACHNTWQSDTSWHCSARVTNLAPTLSTLQNTSNQGLNKILSCNHSQIFVGTIGLFQNKIIAIIKYMSKVLYQVVLIN